MCTHVCMIVKALDCSFSPPQAAMLARKESDMMKPQCVFVNNTGNRKCHLRRNPAKLASMQASCVASPIRPPLAAQLQNLRNAPHAN